jgi:tetratricopeptide (TPR) repeat protein
VLRGRHYRAQDRPSRALREYERGVALGDMTALRYLAGTLSRLGRPAQAEQLYRHAPLGPDEHLSLDYADFLSERGRRDEAYKQLAALADRNSPVAERTLADLLAEDPQRDDEAVSHYLAAIMLGDKEAVTNLGVEWLEQGLIEEAEFALRHAWEDGDDLAGRSLGGLLIDTGHPVEGAAVMKEAATSAGAGTSTESKTQDCGNAIRLTVLPPFTVPERWRRAAAELLARRGEDALPASLPAWMTLLQAAQLSHLLARSASDGDVEEHLHRARWVDTA